MMRAAVLARTTASLALLSLAAAAAIAGCGFPGLPASAGRPGTGPAVTLTEQAARSAFVTVTSATVTGQVLARLVAATARPHEDIDILEAAPQPRVIISAVSPPPAKVLIPARPTAPANGATVYQQAVYQKRLTSWQRELAAGKRAVAARTMAASLAWARALDLPALVRPGTGVAAADPADLAQECAIAASALAGLAEADGAGFGSRRVVLLYVFSLGGVPPAGELAGTDVIVVTPALPSAESVSSTQAALLAAGAAQASVLGPEITASQIAELVDIGLSHRSLTENLSGPALFGNDSAALLPGAGRVLAPLLAPLRQAGAMAVINGYASAPGSAAANYRLSFARATAVAAYLEARGVPEYSLIIVGHGASDLVAPGPSGSNRRVVVVVEEPQH
jgi:outer membrane protein OmpA-like peptidoglycan-associated protein